MTMTKNQRKKNSKKSKVKEEEDDDETPKKRKKKGEEEQIRKWWLEEPLPKGKKWRTLEHSGPYFSPPYEPHGVKMRYDGKPIDLSPDAEEVATFYAQYLETDHVKKDVFNTNFFKDFKKVLSSNMKKGHKHAIVDFEKCDFTPINKYMMDKREKEKAVKKTWTKEQKKASRGINEEIRDKYGYAMVDGYKEKLGNFKVEPPGLFLGRGKHPKSGMLKRRVVPEDVTINISKHAKIPEAPEGHYWKAVIHNDEVSWLAFWNENINDAFKYVWLHSSSRVKGEADMKKFEVARNLKKCIAKIRQQYTEELKKENPMDVRQRATAIYLIDKLALRVGNEKGEDQADTVGCCSLRVEHIKLEEPITVHFDFLGKDSMQYKNTVEVSKPVWENLRDFIKNKKQADEIFHELSTTALNTYLKKLMPGLTAKVFRTYNASATLQKELDNLQPQDLDTQDQKFLSFNRANREVAILCNHQKTISKTFDASIEKIHQQKQDLIEKKKEILDHIKCLKTGKKPKKRKIKIKDEEEIDEKNKVKNEVKIEVKTEVKNEEIPLKNEEIPLKKE